MASIDIAGHSVGAGARCFIIAEAGVNHNGDLDMARRLIDTAAAAGADAVKFQTFKPERLASPMADKADYQKGTTDAAESQLDMLRRLELRPEDHAVLRDHCRAVGILFLSTPFEESSADLLEDLGIEAFKLPSGEVTNLPFLRHVAAKGRPVILSTGMSTLGEVEAAVAAIVAAGNPPLALLHCTSAYPADPAQVNLRAMATLVAAFGVPVGFSDHTPGTAVAIAAAALGAAVIEKHFTLSRDLPGPDHRASLEPDELSAMVAGIRVAESALGDGIKRPQPIEGDTARVARKSLVVARDLPAGALLTPEVLAIMRPGTGLAPGLMEAVLNRRLSRAMVANEPLRWEYLE